MYTLYILERMSTACVVFTHTQSRGIKERTDRLESPLTVLALGVSAVSEIRSGLQWGLWLPISPQASRGCVNPDTILKFRVGIGIRAGDVIITII